MKTRVAINGFGRIGRTAFKIAFERSDIEIVAINDLTDIESLAHLLKRDSNYGTYMHDVDHDDTHLIVGGQSIAVVAEPDPANLPWAEMNVDVVIEATGRFTKAEDASKHVDEAGAKRVVVSAPTKGDGASMIVLGVNDDDLNNVSNVVSNASCTTNCISPVAAVMEAEFGIEKAAMTTIHSYTADQNLQDGPHRKDMRRARAAATNIVPTTTGAAIAAGKVIPSLVGKFDGFAVRVPTPVVSLSDFTILTKMDVTEDQVKQAFISAAAQPYYQGILAVTDQPLVSSDLKGDSHSAIVDLGLTKVIDGNLVKVVVWYDNEWGYSNRLVELVADLGKVVHGGDKDTEENEPEAAPVVVDDTEEESDEVDSEEAQVDAADGEDEAAVEVAEESDLGEQDEFQDDEITETEVSEENDVMQLEESEAIDSEISDEEVQLEESDDSEETKSEMKVDPDQIIEAPIVSTSADAMTELEEEAAGLSSDLDVSGDRLPEKFTDVIAVESLDDEEAE